MFICDILSTEKTPLCLENALEPWYEKMEKADAVIKHIPSDSVDHQFLPFVGKFWKLYQTSYSLYLIHLHLFVEIEMIKPCKLGLFLILPLLNEVSNFCNEAMIIFGTEWK